MIEGLKFQMTSEELVTHLKAREAYHMDKYTQYIEQAERFKDDTEANVVTKNLTNSPAESLRSTAKEHKKKAEYAKWRAEHTIPNEIYYLHANDLTDIEIVSRGY